MLSKVLRPIMTGKPKVILLKYAKSSDEKNDIDFKIDKLNKEIELNEEQIENLKGEAKKLAMAEFEIAEKTQPPKLEETFMYMFKEMPPLLRDQLEAIKERRKAIQKEGGK